jgi:hypothetical protein
MSDKEEVKKVIEKIDEVEHFAPDTAPRVLREYSPLPTKKVREILAEAAVADASHSGITWRNVTVTLGDLKPWTDNPRMSTKAQAKRLLQSFDKFGQVQTVAIDPDCNVLDGHQRLSALLTIHGNKYELDARQSNRPLTDAERRELVVSLHAGAVGSWDWNAISGWNSEELQSWGMDGDALRQWNLDALNLREMIESDGGQDPNEEWEGMPEFEQEDKTAIQSIHVNFKSREDVNRFAELIGQKLTEKTRSIWYPLAEIERYADKRYSDEP